jgi:hypothetical protein
MADERKDRSQHDGNAAAAERYGDAEPAVGRPDRRRVPQLFRRQRDSRKTEEAAEEGGETGGEGGEAGSVKGGKNTGEGGDAIAKAGAAAEGSEAFKNFTPVGAVIDKGERGKIFLIGSAEILKDNVVDENGSTPNATFILNVLDDLNNRDEYAEMRSKTQRFNPLNETSAGVKTFVKSLNIVGLPILIVIFGIIVWVRRTARKKTIQAMFSR